MFKDVTSHHLYFCCPPLFWEQTARMLKDNLCVCLRLQTQQQNLTLLEFKQADCTATRLCIRKRKMAQFETVCQHLPEFYNTLTFFNFIQACAALWNWLVATFNILYFSSLINFFFFNAKNIYEHSTKREKKSFTITWSFILVTIINSEWRLQQVNKDSSYINTIMCLQYLPWSLL